MFFGSTCNTPRPTSSSQVKTILIAPRFNTLAAPNFFSLVVVAIAAAAVGRLASLPLGLVGGLGLGVLIGLPAVMAIMAAANRDPDRFPDPDRLILDRADNKHVAFGWSNHFCFGAPLARMEGQIAFETIVRRLDTLELAPGPLNWRNNSGLRGLTALPITFKPT